MGSTTHLKLLVIGIDGASESVINKMLSQGKLPNFEKLKRSSSYGKLLSTFPPHTAPGWASMFTGVEPGGHGIFQFWDTQPSDYKLRNMNSSDYQREPIWHTLERHGLKVGVNNVPMTHPPVELNGGYMISWPLSTTISYTAPKELKNELLKQDLHYQSDIVTMYRGQSDYCEQTSDFIQKRAETCVYLQQTRPVDAMFVVFTEVDRVSHYYWGDNDEPSEVIEQCYQKMDNAIATLLQLADDETLVIVSSDHGFGRCEADFNVHEALEQQGLLKTKFVPGEDVSNHVHHDDSVAGNWLESSISYRRVINWEQTYFYMPTPGCFGINVNLKGRELGGIVDVEELNEYVKKLEQVISSYSYQGKPCFTLVKSGDVYSGVLANKAPDYLIIPNSFNIMPTPNLTTKVWSSPSQKGVHFPDGILLVSGSTFPKDSKLFARIEDVYPIILAHLNLPVPEPIDGHWLIEPEQVVVREQFQNNQHGRQLTNEESSYLDQQLRDIGYY
ncbi:Phosphodiesterase [Vibrio crassostreae]|nr:Phosphodiesterase [Vibrio crassostreae]CAK2774442.1 Phosphodiesterase [Vibrio crassostreae]CAK3217496.1 Phosphodiesterase [Vibrio crassostreae]CAK3841815.1 Phosphodiesterase [Vibrio crassostreae]